MLAIGLLALAAAGCGGDGKQVLARVNGEKVTARQLDQRVAFFQVIWRHKMAPRELELVRSQFVDLLVDEALLAQEAKKRGLAPQASTVKAETSRLMDTIKSQNFGGSAEQMNRDFKQAGLTTEALQDIVARQLAVDAIFKKETASVQVSDADVRSFYDQNKAQMVVPETVKLSRIKAKTKEDAEKALAELQAGKPFTEVAKEYSSDPMVAAHSGMSIAGLPPAGAPQEVRRGELPPELDKAAFDLDPGKVSQVVESQGAYYVLKVEDKQDSRQRTFEEVKEDVRNYLLQERRKQVFERFVAGLRKSAKIEKKQVAGTSGAKAPSR